MVGSNVSIVRRWLPARNHDPHHVISSAPIDTPPDGMDRVGPIVTEI